MFGSTAAPRSVQRADAAFNDTLREIHVRIIVHARGGVECWPLIMARLSVMARQCEDAETALRLIRARNCLAAAARAYDSMSVLSSGDQIALVQRLPDACEGLVACFVCADTSAERALGASRPFLAPQAFAAGGMVSELVADAVSCGAYDAGGTVCARIDRDHSRERLILADAKQCEAIAAAPHLIQALKAWVDRLTAFPSARRGKRRAPILAPVG